MSRCSECSKPLRPVVAIDVDGTLAEYHDGLAQHAARYFNIKVPFDLWDGEGNYEDYLGITQQQYREVKLAYRQGGYKRWAPVMEGLSYLRTMVRPLGLEVWITTTRPWNRLDSVDPDTRFWLDEHFPVYDHLLYDDHKYKKLAQLVDKDRVVAVVDDLPEMIEEAEDVFGEGVAYMVEREHNLHYRQSSLFGQSRKQVGGLVSATRFIEERTDEWYLKFGR